MPAARDLPEACGQARPGPGGRSRGPGSRLLDVWPVVQVGTAEGASLPPPPLSSLQLQVWHAEGSLTVPRAVVCQEHSQTARRAGASRRRHHVCPAGSATAWLHCWQIFMELLPGQAYMVRPLGRCPLTGGHVPPPVEAVL